MDEEQALWEVATALGVTFDADATRTKAHASAALLALVPEDDTPSPMDREWREGLAAATIPAAVTLLAEGALDPYLRTGDGLSGAVSAVAKLAPLPNPDDSRFAQVLLDKLYQRRHAAN